MPSATTLRRIIDKIREPSTWAGLSIIAVALGVPPGTLDTAWSAAAAIGGIAAIFLDEMPK